MSFLHVSKKIVKVFYTRSLIDYSSLEITIFAKILVIKMEIVAFDSGRFNLKKKSEELDNFCCGRNTNFMEVFLNFIIMADLNI